MVENLERILSEHPFFERLRKDHLEVLVGCASNVRFSEGVYIFQTGGAANEFYLIRDGKVALETAPQGRRRMRILDLTDGDILGWSWMVPPYRWKFDARAVQDTRAIRLDGKCLREKWEKDHDLGFELLRRFTLVSDLRLDAVQRALSMVTDAA